MVSEWDKIKLGDCCDFIGGGTPSKANDGYWKGDIPWISSADISEDRIDSIQISRYITSEAVRNSATHICPRNTINIVSRVGVGKVAISPLNLCTSQDFTNIVPKKHDVVFLAYYLSIAMKRLAEESQGTSIKGVTTDRIKGLSVPLPIISEQTGIATALSDMDNLIADLEKLIAKKKAIKQGAMQDLLTGKKRLPGFSGEWKEKKLGDFIECLRGVSYDGSSDVFQSESDHTIRLLRSNNIQGDTFFNEGIQYINKNKVKEKQIIQRNDIMICMANGSRSLVGKNCIFSEEMNGKYSFGAFMSVARKLDKSINMTYIHYLMNSDEYWRQLSLLFSGSSINNLRPSHILSMEFLMPDDPNEINSIATLLDDMSNEIIGLQNKLEKFRCLKQGMMNKLLTGEIRLV